ncbi:hypothetical protein V2J09_022267 [Rumex salicifolius]
MYLTTTRPDVMYAISLISQYVSRPTELHLSTAKRVLRYLQGTNDFGILYQKFGNQVLMGFNGNDYASYTEDRKSTFGYVFLLSGVAVAWSSRKQEIVTLSTTEAEFVAVAACACLLIWMKQVLKKLSYKGSDNPTIFYDNSSTIKLAKNPIMHGKSKHIDVCFHFLRDLMKYCGTKQQVVDVFTKPLKRETFLELRRKLGLIGSLMYLTTTRQDVMYAISLISQYVSRPSELHLSTAKRVLHYLQGTNDFGILYQKFGNQVLMGFNRNNYASCTEDRKSTSGYVFLLSGVALAWSSRKQAIVTLSTTEAEFVAAAACACLLIWMKQVLKKLSYKGSDNPTIFYDNSSTIKLAKNPIMHGKSKHIDVCFHFLRDLMKYCGTKQQVVDVFTKPLKRETFLELRRKLGVSRAPKIN